VTPQVKSAYAAPTWNPPMPATPAAAEPSERRDFHDQGGGQGGEPNASAVVLSTPSPPRVSLRGIRRPIRRGSCWRTFGRSRRGLCATPHLKPVRCCCIELRVGGKNEDVRRPSHRHEEESSLFLELSLLLVVRERRDFRSGQTSTSSPMTLKPREIREA
jgi:hypothetical protein